MNCYFFYNTVDGAKSHYAYGCDAEARMYLCLLKSQEKTSVSWRYLFQGKEGKEKSSLRGAVNMNKRLREFLDGGSSDL